MKNAGFDMIIFEGRSPNPVYLLVENDNAQLIDASEYWGKSVWDTEEGIKAKHQDPLIRVASIGIAGEKGVKFACVVNDMHRAAGRSGVGTVMGSKNLKAVALRGTLGVSVEDVGAFMKTTSEGKQILADNAVTGQGLPTYGTQVLMNVINEVGALPTHNHRDVQFDGAKNISAEAMAELRADGKPNLVTNAACFGCTIACGRISTVERTHYTVAERPEYQIASGGLEYEAAWALGAATGVDDLDALTFANFICNEQGIDPISFGATVGAAMELYEEGAIGDEQTGGIECKFGSAKALTDLAELTGKGEGFGAEIGLGSKRLCEKYGRPELSMSVKGQEFPAYDSRGIQGMGLAYATANRGACHLRAYTVSSEILGVPEKTDPHVTEGKAGLVKAFQGRDLGGRFFRPLRLHHLRLVARRHRAADQRGLRGRLDDGEAAGGRRAGLEPGAAVQLCGGLHGQGRQPARASAQGRGEDRPGRGAHQRPRQDAAGILRGARLDRRRRTQQRDGGAPRALTRFIRHSRDSGGPRALTRAPAPRLASGLMGMNETKLAGPGRAGARAAGAAKRAKREPTCSM